MLYYKIYFFFIIIVLHFLISFIQLVSKVDDRYFFFVCRNNFGRLQFDSMLFAAGISSVLRLFEEEERARTHIDVHMQTRADGLFCGELYLGSDACLLQLSDSGSLSCGCVSEEVCLPGCLGAQ